MICSQSIKGSLLNSIVSEIAQRETPVSQDKLRTNITKIEVVNMKLMATKR